MRRRLLLSLILRCSWIHIFDGCELGHELSWKCLLVYVLGVVGREVVLGIAQRTAPGLESEVYVATGIQHTLTSYALNGCILNQRHVLNLLKRSVYGCDWDDNALLSGFVERPVVPRETDSVL